MSDEEYEKFEITDYDLDNEFNINRNSGRRPTKNQQIYGIWADESGDEEDTTRPSFKSGRKVKNYTAPIGFVSGGVQQPGKRSDPIKNSNIYEEDDEGITVKQLRGDSSSSEEEGRPSFNDQILRRLNNTEIEGDIAGLRKKKYSAHNPVLVNRGVGTWEKHTKGIGSKLLMQMGYQPGKGLGKDLQGIETPIEAKLRKGRGAIGAYGSESKQKPAEKESKDDKKGINQTEKKSQWRKSIKEDLSKKKKSYNYKTIEEILDQSTVGARRREFNELSKVKVIDMTGPEQRILTGYHAISGVQKPSEQWDVKKDKNFQNFSMPELLHNLNILVDMCEQDIIENDRKLKYNEDRIVGLDHELDNLEKVMNQEEFIIKNLDHVLAVIQKISTESNEGTISLEEVADLYQDLQENYFSEYCMYDLPSLAPNFVQPLLKTQLSAWDPLKEAGKPINIYNRWRALLEKDAAHTLTTATVQDPYHKIIWDTWMPSIRIAVSAWNCKHAEQMIELIKTWSGGIVPRWIMENLLQQIILPKLQKAVEEWNPLTDTVPIHSWTQPWLPYAEKRLQVSVFPVIRQKLSVCLNSWHPSDTSARLMLLPWINIFSKQEMATFILNNIIPKLAQSLQEFIVNPQHQTFDHWNWVMDWKDTISDNVMADLLDKAFFPKWLQVLSMWLNMNPNYDQVTRWYQKWKETIPMNIRNQQVVKDRLRTALDMMSRSVDGPVTISAPPRPAQPPPPPEISGNQRFHIFAEATRTANQMVEGFKDLVAKRCEEKGIVFLPLANRYREGKQVYRLGVYQIYIDRNVLFYSEDSIRWAPISLATLLNMAQDI